MEIRLEAKNATEKKVLEYLQNNASEALAGKINGGKRTLADAVKYAAGEALKQAGGGGCAFVDDDTVYGWIVHFFEENGTEETKGTKVEKKEKKEAKPEAAAEDEPEAAEEEAGMFGDVDLLGGGK